MEKSKEFSKTETELHKKLLKCEMIIGWMAMVPAFVLIIVAGLIEMPDFARIILLSVAIVIILVGALLALKIEVETGHYKCENCKHEYVPKYSKALFAPHVGRIRHMACPKCGKKSWQRKAI